MARRGDDGPTGRTRYGIIVTGAALLALVAGIGVAGLPQSVPNDISASEIQPPPSSTTTTVPATAARTTDDASETTESEEEDNELTEPSTSLRGTSTTLPATTSTLAAPRAPSEVRVVVANGGGADGLATRVADQLRAEGYVDVLATNAAQRRNISVVFFASGFEREADELAALVGIADVQLQPTELISVDGDSSDLWLVLGVDRVE